MAPSRRTTGQAALTVGALGVVFGDIGTSPLYTVQTVFNPSDPHPVKVTTEHIFGIVSLIFWSVTIIVSVTYVWLVMRADNDGEGGIMALISLIRKRGSGGAGRTKLVLAALGIFGASLFFGDSMITPAISVLSAVEGVKVAEPSVSDLVIPITVAIIIVLFLFQRVGTGAVGRLFGPVMGIWFAVIAGLGVRGIVMHPAILKALSPTYAIGFLVGHFGTAFFSLTAVVLAVTGAEALYADMGHFGRPPIRRAWLLAVFPACILNYLGQGALILGNHDTISNPFFLLAPAWARLPMVFLATVATVIASQAVITGAYSVAHQAAGLGYLPRLRIRYTSEETMGQIYIPWINWLLLVTVLTLVLTFRSSDALAYAYGTAVTGTITITTMLFFYIARQQWRWPLWIVVAGGGALLIIDLLFFTANLTKVVHGAWLPLLIGITVFTIFSTWQKGRHLVTAQRVRDEGPLQEFIDQLHAMTPPLPRVPGTGVFLNRGKATAPLALRANVEHNHILHDHVLIVSMEMKPTPYVPDSERLELDDLGYAEDQILYVTARFGYMDQLDVPALLPLISAAGTESPRDDEKPSYFLSRIELVQGNAPGMSRWRKHLFIATSRITADAAESFQLPRDATVVMGSRIELLCLGRRSVSEAEMDENLAAQAELALELQGNYDSLFFEGQWHTNGRLAERAARLATGFADLGVRPGDRLLVLMANCPEVPITYTAAWRAGAVVTPLIFLVSEDELRHALIDSGAVGVITTVEFLPKVVAAAAGAPGVRFVVIAGSSTETAAHDVRLLDFAEVASAEPGPIISRSGTDLAALLYTGGTTGRSKGVPLTHANLRWCGRAAHESSVRSHVMSSILPLPLAHAYGLLVLCGSMHRTDQAKTILMRWFDPAGWVKLAEQHRVQGSSLVPSMIQMLLTQPLEEADLSELITISSGAAPLAAEVRREFETRVPTATVYEGYGCTEAATFISANPFGARRIGSVGLPVPGCEVSIQDDAGQVLPPESDGEICVRSPGVMTGYWHTQDSSATVLAGGWLHTGDIGRLDGDGYLYVLDRKKDLILRGGFNVYPRDVEDVLVAHPAVAQAGVVARPDTRLGEEIVAFVSLRPGAETTADELTEYAKAHLAANKYPRQITIVPATPLTSVGKLDRKKLRQWAAGL